MRERFAPLMMTLLLLALFVGCGEKPAQESSETPGQNATQAKKGGGSPSLVQRLSGKVTVPEGTVLTVRLGQSLSSKSSNTGDSFNATVAEPVEVNGKVVIPQGATASGTVVDAKSMGHFKGGALLQVALNSVTVNGKSYNIETSAVERSAKGKGKRSAVLIGGGAGAGALIGGLAGGGKGAAIGAIAGAGAGTAGAAYTGNKDIVLPAESALSFKLLRPVEVNK